MASQVGFGLTEDEKQRINKVWDLAKNDMATIGVDLLIDHFKTYPASMRFFRFKTTDLDQLAKAPSLKFHASRIMREIDFYVENIDDTESVLHGLTENAHNHKKRNIPKSEYDDLLSSILNTFEGKLGREIFDNATKETWTKVLKLLFNVITEENAKS